MEQAIERAKPKAQEAARTAVERASVYGGGGYNSSDNPNTEAQNTIYNSNKRDIFETGAPDKKSIFNNDTDNAMYTETEQYHKDTMNGYHNDYQHSVNELKDLYKAGIIEKNEFDDRIRALR